MKRRDVLLGLLLAAAVLIAASGQRLTAQEGGATGGVLKGFVIADAHFGWDNPQQPSPDEQRQMLRRILKRFPDLDVLMDVGDAYHSADPSCDEGRRQWTDVVVSGCGPIPFFYITGSHELARDWRHLDAEEIAPPSSTFSADGLAGSGNASSRRFPSRPKMPLNTPIRASG